MNNGGRVGPVEFTVNEWSTDADRDALLAIMKAEKDPYRANAKVLTMVERMPFVGKINEPGQAAGVRLRLAFQTPLEGGGRRIVLATDIHTTVEPEGPATDSRADYHFLVAEIRLDRSDRGEGKISRRTKLLVDKDNHFVLDNYDRLPVDFNQIHRK